MKEEKLWVCSKCGFEKLVERGSVFRDYPKGLSCIKCGAEMKLNGKAENVIRKLKSAFPKIKGIRPDGENIHLGNAAEGGTIDGAPAADWWTEFGYQVHPKLTKLLTKLGYAIEWYDSGTIVAFKK